ncbi:MAG: CRISPR system precrRNA processing endoribonuclease RAMP protein Cas6 [Chloroflexota bacterium]|nr:CRISPR system precrRNA processing endoribonuclease RAMP protein Cas6 [Chloroflexota bacterium]
MTDTIQLPNLHIALFRFTLEPRTPLHLPPYKGSVLRGGFGHVFKRTVCVQPRVRTCATCLLAETCAYAYLFETRPPPGSQVLRTHEAVPRPFVIRPPLDRRTEIPAGEPLTFGLVLVGRAMGYLPYFLVVFRELGEAGLGRGRGKYILREVRAVHPLSGEERLVYDGETLLGTGLEVAAEKVAAWAEELPFDRLTVRFLTPARLKHGGEFMRAGVDFHVLVRALLRRLSSLSYFHCGERWETDYPGWVERAEQVEVAETHLSWVEWERYSGRQAHRIKMGGVVGSVTYAGDLAPFRPLLALGMLAHVGKGAVFGNGLYTMANEQMNK